MTSFEISVLYESKWVIVIEKPTGLLVEAHWKYPSVESWVKDYLSKQYKNPFVGIVHRIDRMVSGVVIVAKKRSALRHLNEQMRMGQIDKFYSALTSSKPHLMEGALDTYMGRSKDGKKAVRLDSVNKMAKRAKLKFRVAKRNNIYQWDIKLITGRYHQIRLQLAGVGCPIIGDILYGSSVEEELVGIGLHCYQMVFVDPGLLKRITIKSREEFNPIWKKYLETVG
ncbi:MAG: RluA family pseudouridine synthase [Saprospiraceae bacterium]|jgi:23S rRNA-/tRNA-specific pseudouridylate synthase